MTMLSINLFLLLVVLEGTFALTRTNDSTIKIGDLGWLKGKVMKTKGYKGSTPKVYHSYRNIAFATNYTKQHRFKESVMYHEPFGLTKDHPADKSKDGPICQQGSLNEFYFHFGNKLKIDKVVDLVLQRLNISGRIPDQFKHVLPDINSDFVLSILEKVFSRTFKGKTLEQVTEDWLDTTLSVDEKCLNLNVAKPAYANATSNLPVIFYIYGGGYVSGFQLKSFPERLGDAEDIIFVSANYRVGHLGFMCMDNDEAAGNMGLLDQVLALQWVQKYITHFGGDPNRVTIYGESAGSASVSHLILSPYVSQMDPPLFHQAIGSSGSALSPWAFGRNPEYHAHKFIEMILSASDCKRTNTTAAIDCLRDDLVQASTISNTTSKYRAMQQSKGEMGFGGVSPCAQKKGTNKIYGEYDDPVEIARTGSYRKIPVLMGANSHEGTYVYDSVYKGFLDKNNLTKDVDFLTHGFMDLMLKSVKVQQNKFFADLVKDQFFFDGHIGNLSLMTPGAIDALGALFMKASTYEFVSRNSEYNNSYWYSLEQKSRKSFAYLGYGINKPLPLGTLNSPGVAHVDDLWHVFNYELPFVWCDLKPILASMVVTGVSCASKALLKADPKFDWPTCLTDSTDGFFISTAGECLDGSLTPEDELTSHNMVQAYASFAKNGKPSIMQDNGNVFNIEPWTRDNPVYMQFASDGVHKQIDYTKTYHVARDEAYGQPTTPTPPPTMPTTVRPHPKTTSGAASQVNSSIASYTTIIMCLLFVISKHLQ